MEDPSVSYVEEYEDSADDAMSVEDFDAFLEIKSEPGSRKKAKETRRTPLEWSCRLGQRHLGRYQCPVTTSQPHRIKLVRKIATEERRADGRLAENISWSVT